MKPSIQNYLLGIMLYLKINHVGRKRNVEKINEAMDKAISTFNKENSYIQITGHRGAHIVSSPNLTYVSIWYFYITINNDKEQSDEIRLKVPNDNITVSCITEIICTILKNKSYYNKEISDESDNKLSIKKVIFNRPATIVLWEDGTKTVVKCDSDEDFDYEKGLAMAISKKALGNKGNYYKFKKHITNSDDANSLTLEDVRRAFTHLAANASKILNGEK